VIGADAAAIFRDGLVGIARGKERVGVQPADPEVVRRDPDRLAQCTHPVVGDAAPRSRPAPAVATG
jgi:hypothetical protein